MPHCGFRPSYGPRPTLAGDQGLEESRAIELLPYLLWKHYVPPDVMSVFHGEQRGPRVTNGGHHSPGQGIGNRRDVLDQGEHVVELRKLVSRFHPSRKTIRIALGRRFRLVDDPPPALRGGLFEDGENEVKRHATAIAESPYRFGQG